MISPEVHRQLIEQALEPYQRIGPNIRRARRRVETSLRLSNALVIRDGDLNRACLQDLRRALIDAKLALKGL